MNQPPDNETEAIRSDIDTTRRRMDDTMDALGDRLKGRHLIDEILGFFRSDNPKGSQFREKISETASGAASSLANTIKENPIPLLLIGAGVGWMIYESRRKASQDYSEPYDEDEELYREPAQNYSAGELDYDRPLEYGTSESGYGTPGYTGGTAGEATSKLGEAKDKVVEKASETTRQVKQKLSQVGDRVRDKTHQIGERAKDMGARVQETAREAYGRTRERVATTAQEHPLELGLACLALGIVAGLALPTPQKVNRLAGPALDRLRDRTRSAGNELLEKGQRVATAAATAVKNEAQAQGLTMESLREKAGEVAKRGKEVVADAARQEGVLPEEAGRGSPPVSSASPNDPAMRQTP